MSLGRKLPEERVRELIDLAPISANEAREAGLVDYLGYRDEVRAAVDRRWAEKPTCCSSLATTGDGTMSAALARRGASGGGTYRRRWPDTHGAVQAGPCRAGSRIRHDCAAFRAATKDERIKAIVFRVNSPGGSYVASDTIWREVCKAREAGKPIVASMGDLAASGGYFVAMAADVIVAEPATLTGSIGVFAGKMRTRGLFQRLGVNVDTLGQGRHALMFSPQTGFSEDEWARLNEWLDFVYDDFTSKVALGRAMSREAVHEVAHGRVWTGADALQRGLVDEMGGLRRAMEIARERSGLPADAPVRPFPAIAPVQRLRQPRNSDDPAAFAQARAFGTDLFEWGGTQPTSRGLGPALGRPTPFAHGCTPLARGRT